MTTAIENVCTLFNYSSLKKGHKKPAQVGPSNLDGLSKHIFDLIGCMWIFYLTYIDPWDITQGFIKE